MELRRSEVMKEFAYGCLELTGQGYSDRSAQLLMSYALAEKYDVLRNVLWDWLVNRKGDEVWWLGSSSSTESTPGK